MAKLNQNLVTHARRGGGSFKTVSDRMKIADRLAERLIKLNIQIRDAQHVKTSHIEAYIRSRLAENISARTLQNEMAAIRAIFRSAGKTLMADPKHQKLSNTALGISSASRDGTKVAIPDKVFHRVLEKVMQVDKGAAISMRLSRALGLRTEETIQSAKSLHTWKNALARNEEKIRVVFGTKGGRPRDVTVIRRDDTVNLVNEAVKFIEGNNRRLINKAALHLAIERYRNIVRNAGLTGKYAPHSLRYAYAVDAMNYHLNKGFTTEEAQALVSMDLGHGDGRGKYIARVYNKPEND